MCVLDVIIIYVLCLCAVLFVFVFVYVPMCVLRVFLVHMLYALCMSPDLFRGLYVVCCCVNVVFGLTCFVIVSVYSACVINIM